MDSESFHISPEITIEIIWCNRLHDVLTEYSRRCALEDGVAAFHYTDSTIKQAYADMDAFVNLAKPLIKRIYTITGQLPVIGDQLHPVIVPTSFVSALDVFISDRLFYAYEDDSKPLSVVYLVDTNAYDWILEDVVDIGS